MPRKQPFADLFTWEQFEEWLFSSADTQDKRTDRSLANNEIKNKDTVSRKSN